MNRTVGQCIIRKLFRKTFESSLDKTETTYVASTPRDEAVSLTAERLTDVLPSAGHLIVDHLDHHCM